jgi:hypothetical protein
MSLVPVSSFDVMPQAADLAARIARTEFVPQGLRNRPEAVLAAVLAGHEMGIGPMESLSHIAVIDGRPTFAAELMRAQVLRRGHEIWVEESTVTRAIVVGRRHGSAHEVRATWTMDDARKANLAGKRNWQHYPRQMLVARASAELIRNAFPDVLGATRYVTEEVLYDPDFERLDVDQPTAEGNGSTAPAPAKRTAKRAARATKAAAAPIDVEASGEEPPNPLATIPDPSEPLPVEEPPAAPQASQAATDGPAPSDSPPEATAPVEIVLDRLTDDQRRAIMALSHQIGFDRTDRLTVGASLIGRPLDTMNALSRGEASLIIDAFTDVTTGARVPVLDDAGRAVRVDWSEVDEPGDDEL